MIEKILSLGEEVLFSEETLEEFSSIEQKSYAETGNINWSEYSHVVLQHSEDQNPFTALTDIKKKNPDINVTIFTFQDPEMVMVGDEQAPYPEQIITKAYIDTEIELLQLVLTQNIDKTKSGLNPYMNATKMQAEVEVSDSEFKELYLNMITLNAVDNGFSQKTILSIANALDEMISNAIYNAPTDKEGNYLYKSLPRNERVQLEDHQSAIITYGFDSEKLGVSIKDPFGSLGKNKVWEILRKCSKSTSYTDDSDSGGGGLGIYTILKNVHHLIINIHGGTSTEFIIFVKKARKKSRKYSPSISISSVSEVSNKTDPVKY